jgi:Fic-DOC domain mobile mystery protein B
MTLFTPEHEGNTPLSPEESLGLLPNLSTREELNQWERENILKAGDWALRQGFNPLNIVSEQFVRKLHLKMFDDTWQWAGSYRSTEKNIGVAAHEIRDNIASALGDVRFWIEEQTYDPDEIAVRFHHRLVYIHPFPNGNGRFSRLIAELLIVSLKCEPFTWGTNVLINPREARVTYLAALHAADAGDIGPLLRFARS